MPICRNSDVFQSADRVMQLVQHGDRLRIGIGGHYKDLSADWSNRGIYSKYISLLGFIVLCRVDVCMPEAA